MKLYRVIQKNRAEGALKQAEEIQEIYVGARDIREVANKFPKSEKIEEISTELITITK